MLRAFISTLALGLSMNVFAAPIIGQEAPDFQLRAEDGKHYKLSQYRGKTVVLEWLNHGCPFVRKHYDSGNMTAMQAKYTGKDVVWLSIVSSAEGKQGHVDMSGAFSEKQKYKSQATHILLDPQGEVGRTYDAKTTPHMYVIDSKGILQYAGAIDSIPSADQADIKKATNYVAQALDEVMAGNPVKITSTKAYGCSVKY